MSNVAETLNDPAFQQLLKRRSRLRWGFSISLISAYLVYGTAGLGFKDAYAAPFLGGSMPWGMALGFMLIGSSVLMSMIYVRVVNRIEADSRAAMGSAQ